MRARDPDQTRDARVSAARGSRRHRGRHVVALLRAGPARRRFRDGHRERDRAHACRSAVPLSARGRARRRDAGRELPRQRSRARVAACRSFFGAAFPTTSCSPLRPRAGCTSRPRSSGRCGACSRTRARPRSSRTSPGSGSSCASSTMRCRKTRASTRSCAPRSGARPSCCSSTCCARIAACSSCSTARYTFLDERLARHYGIDGVARQLFPPCGAARGQPARRTPGLGQHPHGNLGRQSHVACRARRVDRREPARRRGAAPAAGCRSRPVGRALARRSEDAAPAHGGASHGLQSARRATSSSTRSASRSRTSISSAAGATATPASRSTPRRGSSTARRSTAPRRCAPRCSTAPTPFVTAFDRTAPDLRARPNPRSARQAGRAPDRRRRSRRRVSFLELGTRRREQRAVSHADEARGQTTEER